jgi:uncharacterized protein (TIGR01319 family)
VEGDLGIRVNAPTILQMAGAERLATALEGRLSADDILERVRQLSVEVDRVPREEAEHHLDAALAREAIDAALERHAGRVGTVYTPSGAVELLYGKDLSAVATMIGTGGVFAYGRNPWATLKAARYNPDSPTSLRPRDPRLLIDRRYIFFAAGLFAPFAPRAARNVLRRTLSEAEDACGVV